MRASFSVGQHVGRLAPLDVVEAAVVGVLERLEGAQEVVDGETEIGGALGFDRCRVCHVRQVLCG